MKRLICFLTAVLCLFCSCTAQKGIGALTESFRSGNVTGTAVLSYADLTVKSEFSVSESGVDVRVTEPSELSGMHILCTDGEIALEYAGINVKLERLRGAQIPMAALTMLFETLANANEADFTLTYENDEYTLDCGGELSFAITFDESAIPICASYVCNERVIAVRFENIKSGNNYGKNT